MNRTLADRLRAELQAAVPEVPDAMLAVAYRGGPESWAGIVTAASGPASASPASEPRFLIYSLAKSFTAALVLRLVAAGKLALDAPLARWLPEVPNAVRITLRHCLQHTGGLPDYGPLPAYHEAVRRGGAPWTFEEFLARTRAERLQFEPGKGWGYSNIGHMLVRRLIERATERPLAEVMTEEVCRPLGLLRTDVVSDRAALRGLVAGYSVALADGGPAVDVRERYDPGWVATGVMASTASEVVRFYQGLFAGELVPANLLADMCAVVRTMPTHPHFVTPSYGLGLMADPDSPYGSLFGHNGGGPGYTASSFHCRLPEGEPVTVAVLANFEAPVAVQRMAFVVREVVGTKGER